MKRIVLKFKAIPSIVINSVVRHPHPSAKFWRVYKIVDGVAYAKADGFGPSKGAC